MRPNPHPRSCAEGVPIRSRRHNRARTMSIQVSRDDSEPSMHAGNPPDRGVPGIARGACECGEAAITPQPLVAVVTDEVRVERLQTGGVTPLTISPAIAASSGMLRRTSGKPSRTLLGFAVLICRRTPAQSDGRKSPRIVKARNPRADPRYRWSKHLRRKPADTIILIARSHRSRELG